MPRVARIVLPGYAHHVTQRGNNRQDVFFVDQDRKVYLEILAEQSALYGLTVEGYCLMGNHVHIIGTPQTEESLSKSVGRTHWLYTQYVNRMHGRSGHLWQNRFYSCPLDQKHFLEAMRYIELNPVRAKICRIPWRYTWSIAAAHAGKKPPNRHGDGSELPDLANWKTQIQGLDWEQVLREGIDVDRIEGVRLHTNRGRPLASDKLLSKLEVKLGRRLRPLPVGRPKKNKTVNNK